MVPRLAPMALRMPISPGTLGDGDHHDVHDADTAHNQRDGGNAAQEDRQNGGDVVHGFFNEVGGGDGKGILVLVKACHQKPFNGLLRLLHAAAGGGADVEGADLRGHGAGQPHQSGVGNVGHEGTGSEHGGQGIFILLQNAHNGKFHTS